MKLQTILFLAASALPAFALDLSPQFVTTVEDGKAYRRPYFSDGDKKYTVSLDTETELTADADGALFRFVKFSRADMRLRPSPLSVDVKIEPGNQEQYESAARKLLPVGAKDIVLDQVTSNPEAISGWTSVCFTFHYSASGTEVRESVTFMNLLPKTQVVVQTSSTTKDFAEATFRAFDTIRRWRELDSKSVSARP